MPTFEAPHWLKSHSTHAKAQVERLGTPSRKHEAWLYTSLEQFVKKNFLATETGPQFGDINQKSIEDFVANTGADAVLVFTNGHYLSASSKLVKNSNIKIKNIKQLLIDGKTEGIQQQLTREPNKNLLGVGWSAFTASRDGAFIDLSHSEKPMRILVLHHYSSANSQAGASQATVQNIYKLDRGAKAEICEVHLDFSLNQNSLSALRIHNLTDIVLEEGATLNFGQTFSFKNENEAYVFNDTQLNIKSSAQLDILNYSVGGRLVRHEYDAHLSDVGAQIKLNSLNVGLNKSHTVMSSHINHQCGQTQSAQLAKSILDDESEFVFSGRLEIAQDAQKSDASQYNHNILLSDKASVFTRPQLQVNADDVKAAHGATLGSIHEDELFYLQSRAISKDRAMQMLIDGFVKDLFAQADSSFIRDTAWGVYHA